MRGDGRFSQRWSHIAVNSMGLNQLIASDGTPKSLAKIEVFGDLKKNYLQVNEAITTLSNNINSLSSNNTELKNKVNFLSKSIESLSQPKPPAWEFPTSFTPSLTLLMNYPSVTKENVM